MYEEVDQVLWDHSASLDLDDAFVVRHWTDGQDPCDWEEKFIERDRDYAKALKTIEDLEERERKLIEQLQEVRTRVANMAEDLDALVPHVHWLRP